MNYDELRKAVDAIESDERRASVRFGCDGGCGGDTFTEDYWEEMCDEADAAEAKLRAIGITFDEDQQA
ncbi:hypothetical protein ATO13_23311 [Stappia sp. 22II-S9-Z10]|nr:hypothetical protein ATO13_23311 [Stappia sp. 22II-S9-Z10]